MKVENNFETADAHQLDMSDNFIATFEQLVQLGEESARFGSIGDNLSVRQALDKFRQVWSSFSSDFLEFDINHNVQNRQKLNELVQRFDKTQPFIQAWSKRFEPVIDNEEFRNSDEGLQYLIDSRLPPAWNWEKDLVVLFSKQKNRLESFLRDRGQKNIFRLTGRASKEDLKAIETFFVGAYSSDIPKRMMPIETPASDRQSEQIVRCMRALAVARFKSLSFNFTLKKDSGPSSLQRIKNSVHFVKSLQIQDLKPHISGKPVVLVSPGPSLLKNINLLKDLEDNIIIVAVAQSVPALLKHSIQPDYVVAIDPINYSSILDGLNYQKTNAIFIDTVHGDFFNKPFKNIYTGCNVHTPKNLLKVLDWNTTDLVGSSVSVFSFNLLAHLEASAVALVGQDLATSEGSYYVGDGMNPLGTAPEDLLKSDRPSDWELPGYSGGVVLTQGDYFIYHGEFVESVKKLKMRAQKIQLYNCTEGGAFIKGFSHKPLRSFMEKFASTRLYKDRERCEPSITLVRPKSNLVIKYLEDLKKCCNETIHLIQEGEQIFSGNKKISLLEKNSTALQQIVLKNAELATMAYGYMAEIQGRLERNKVIKNDHQISRELYSLMKHDCEQLVDTCSEAILALKCL